MTYLPGTVTIVVGPFDEKSLAPRKVAAVIAAERLYGPGHYKGVVEFTNSNGLVCQEGERALAARVYAVEVDYTELNGKEATE